MKIPTFFVKTKRAEIRECIVSFDFEMKEKKKYHHQNNNRTNAKKQRNRSEDSRPFSFVSSPLPPEIVGNPTT
jgi:hypothetical protein